jgi:hypothetical protein
MVAIAVATKTLLSSRTSLCADHIWVAPIQSVKVLHWGKPLQSCRWRMRYHAADGVQGIQSASRDPTLQLTVEDGFAFTGDR